MFHDSHLCKNKVIAMTSTSPNNNFTTCVAMCMEILKGSVQWKNDFSSNRSLNIVKKDGILNFIVIYFV